MKVVILAGGYGTRLSEETVLRPKPLVEIGGQPILWHVMKIYSHYGLKDFVICLGYKGHEIKNYFANYSISRSDVTMDLGANETIIHANRTEDWRVTLVETGHDSMTGGRIKCIESFLDDDEPFCLTYGDGVGNIDIGALIEFHKSHGKIATVTAVTPPGRYGVLDLDGTKVLGFREKIASDQYRINAGFFVLEKKAIGYIDNPATIWEQEPMVSLAKDGELMAFEHNDFWMPMDTLRDKNKLEELWQSGEAPWKIW